MIMSFHRGPKIVTDGLVLALDAGNIKSYSGSGTIWNDLSRNGNNGTLQNNVSYNDGYLTFDGSNDYVNVSDNSLLDFDGFDTALTSEVWINFNQHKDITFVNAKGPGSGIAAAYNYFFIGTSNTFYFRISDGVSTQNSPIIGASLLPIGSWNNITAVLESDKIRIYLNGVEVGTPTNRTINTKSNNNDFLISSSTYTLNGSVAISRIYNRALTESEIQQNYNANKNRFGL